MQQLIDACGGALASGRAAGFAVGSTELGDPQLYLLGPAPDHDCILCVSRLGRLYVLEDGNGKIMAEHDSLAVLAEAASGALQQRGKAAIVARVTVAWCTLREMFEEKIELMLAEPMEVVTHFAPQLAVLA
jgi:hypothetical protein